MKRSDVLSSIPLAGSDFVVEIGAGHMPFSRTNLIVDKYPFENRERFADIQNIAPVIKADAVKLPLADSTVDLLFASHVLEHVEDPARFIAEAKRCSRRVYLEFPSLRRELMYAWSFHHWVIEVSGTKLTFYANDIPQVFDDFFHRGHDLVLETWSQSRFEELNNHVLADAEAITLEFSEKTALQHALEAGALGEARVNFAPIEKKDYSVREMLKLVAFAAAPPSLIRAKTRFASRLNRRRRVPLSEGLLERLICQNCGAPQLEFAGAEVRCRACDARYRETEGVYDFDV